MRDLRPFQSDGAHVGVQHAGDKGDDLVGVAVVLVERIEVAAHLCPVPHAAPGGDILLEVAEHVERRVRMDAVQQGIFALGDVLPLVHEHQPVAGLELPPRLGQAIAHGIPVRGIDALHAVFCLGGPDRLPIQPAGDVRAAAALSELDTVTRQADDGKEIGEQGESLLHFANERAGALRLRLELFAAGDAVGVGEHLLRASLLFIAHEVGNLLVHGDDEGGKVLLRAAEHLLPSCRNQVGAAVELRELTKEIVGRALVFFEHEAQKVLRLRERAHQRAKGLGEVEAALLALLELAQHGAAHAHRTVADAHKLRLPLPAHGKDGFGHRAALGRGKQGKQLLVQFMNARRDVPREAGRVDIGKVLLRLAGVRQPGLEVNALPRERTEVVVAQRGRAHLFQFQHLRELVDEAVEALRRRDDEHVPGVQALVVVHEIAQAVQQDHRLAAARAALQHKTLALGLGDNVELLLLNGSDDIADFDVVLAALNDASQVRIEQDLLVPAADLLGR